MPGDSSQDGLSLILIIHFFSVQVAFYTEDTCIRHKGLGYVAITNS